MENSYFYYNNHDYIAIKNSCNLLYTLDYVIFANIL